MQWRCDYCIIALFETYEEAETHELNCPARLAAMPAIPAAPRVDVVPDDAHEETTTSRQRHQQQQTSPQSENGRVAPSKKQKCGVKTTPSAMWACDFCQLFQSPDYDEVLEHERECGKDGHTTDHQKEDDSNEHEKEEAKDDDEDSAKDEKPVSEGKNDKANDLIYKPAQSSPSSENYLSEKTKYSTSEAFECFPLNKINTSSSRNHDNNATKKALDHSLSSSSNQFFRQERGTNETWSTEEHNHCLASIVANGPNWDLSATSIKTRTTQQVEDYALHHFSHLLPPNEPPKTTLKRTKWRCDVCRVAIFEEYEKAVEHESKCFVADEGTEADSDTVDAVKTKKSRKNEEWKPEQMVVDFTRSASNGTDLKDCTNEVNSDPKHASPESVAHTKRNIETFSMATPKSITCVATSLEKNEMKVSATSMKPTSPIFMRREELSNPESMQSKTELLEFLDATTSEMAAMENASNVLVKERRGLTADLESVEMIAMPSNQENFEECLQRERVTLKNNFVMQAKEHFASTLSTLMRLGMLSAPLALFFKYQPQHLFDNIIDASLVPTVVFMVISLVVLIMSTVASSALALVATHGGGNRHRSRGAFMDILTTVRDTFCRPADMNSVDLGQPEVAPLPTLREYLHHPDGFHMAFAPAFFGFFAYFGALTALEEETNGLIVPSATGKNSDNDASVNTCGLKSVAGASAGAMAAVMLAAGIHPRKAAEFACNFNWSMVADPPGFGGFVKGDKFEEFMRSFIKETTVTRNGDASAKNEGSVMLEDALVPVAVSGFDLLRMKGVLMSRGCMAKAARSSAGFPALFQPVPWRNDRNNADNCLKRFPDMLLIDGGIRDVLGLNGLSACPSNSARGMRVINMAVGGFGLNRPRGMKDLPVDIYAESLVSIAIENTPMCGPWAMENGPRAVESARMAMLAAMDIPLERGTSTNHYILRVDASRCFE